MSSGSGSQNNNISSTTTSRPPDYALPFARSYMNSMYNYLFPNGQMLQYPNAPQQLQGFTPTQVQGMNQATALANQGSPANTAEGQMLTATQQGQYLNPSTNPYLKSTYDTAAQSMVNQYQDATQPSIQAQFAQAGNFGSSAQADAQDSAKYGLGQNLATLAADIYGGNYTQERQNQLTAAGLIPSQISGQFLAPQELMDIGGQQQQFGQNVLNTAYSNENAFNMWPQNVLNQYGQSIATGIGNSSQQTTTEPNPYAQTSGLNTALGLGGAGAGLLGLLYSSGII